MITLEKLRVPMVARYFLSAPIAFVTSLVVLACYGFPEKGATLLSAERVIIFATVFLGGFCFPALSRWLHSAALLGFGVALYCVLNPIDEMSLQWDFLPQFRVVIGGGSLAVASHVIIDLVCWMTRGLTNRWIQPPPRSQDERGSNIEPPDSSGCGSALSR